MLSLPYPGLRPFRPDETHIYFGRENHTDDLLVRLEKSRFLAVIGPSGCGKSSLINTGLIPALQLGMLADPGARWQVARMQPRGQPMKNLAQALVESGVSSSVVDSGQESSDTEGFSQWVQHTLERGPLGLKEVLNRHPLAEKTNLLLVVDQFEEIFRYRRMISSDEADAFIALLLGTAGLKTLPVFVIITMRSDFLGDCTVFPGLPEAINSGQFLTPQLTREEIGSAIEGPAQVYGGSVDTDLVTRLLNVIRNGDDQLPVLQHAMMRMWMRALEHQENTQVLDLQEDESPPATLTSAIYDEVGGLQNALSNHADEAFDGLDESGQRIARLMFCALTERMKRQQDIRRPVILAEVADIACVEWQKVAEVADAFRRADRSFLVPPPQSVPHLTPQTELDISHESLIRQWRRMSVWVKEEFEHATIYRRLEERAALWKNGKADFLGDIELNQFTDWRDRSAPSETWAKRYGSQFPLAMEFLDASDKAHLATMLAEKDMREAEELRNRQEAVEKIQARYQRKRNQRILRGIFVTSTLLTIAAIGWLVADKRGDSAVYAHLYERAQSRSMMALDQKQPARALLMALLAGEYLKETSHSDRGQSDVNRLFLKNFQTESGISKVYENQTGTGRVYAVVFSPAGDQVAIAGQDGGSKFGTVSLRDTHGGKELLHLRGHEDAVTAASYSSSGAQLITGSWDGTIRLWDTKTGEQIGPEHAAQCLVDDVQIYEIAPGKQIIYALGRIRDINNKCQYSHSEIWYWEQLDNKVITPRQTLAYESPITGFSIAQEKKLLVVSTQAGELEFHLADNPLEMVYTPDVFISKSDRGLSIVKLAVDTAGTRLAIALQDKSGARKTEAKGQSDIILWNIEDLANIQELAKLRGQTELLTMRFDNDARWLASGGKDAQVLIWDIGSALGALKPTTVFTEHKDWVRSVVFSPDAQYLLSGSGSGRSILWSVEAQKNLYRILKSHEDEVWTLGFAGDSDNSGLLMSGGPEKKLSLWDLSNLDDVSTTKTAKLNHDSSDVHEEAIVGAVFSPQTGVVLTADSGGGSGPIFGWKIKDGSLTRDSSRDLILSFDRTGKISGLALSPDGNYLAFSNRLGELALWRWSDSRWVEENVPAMPDKKITGWGDNLTFSADGSSLAFGVSEVIDKDDSQFTRRKHFVHFLNIPELVLDEATPDSTGEIYSVAYSSPEQNSQMPERLAFAGNKHKVHVWKKDSKGSWVEEYIMSGHVERVNSIAFSPDGKTIASGSRDRDVRLWDTQTGDWIATLVGHEQWVDRVAFSPNGNRLASSGDDHQIFLWNVDFASYPKIACEMSTRNLDQDEWDAFIGQSGEKDWWESILSGVFLVEEPEYLAVCTDYPSGEKKIKGILSTLTSR